MWSINPACCNPEDLDGLPLQVIGSALGIPLGAHGQPGGERCQLDQDTDIDEELEAGLTKFLKGSLETGMANLGSAGYPGSTCLDRGCDDGQ